MFVAMHCILMDHFTNGLFLLLPRLLCLLEEKSTTTTTNNNNKTNLKLTKTDTMWEDGDLFVSKITH